MADGFVTVAQCVEGLPLGRFVGELLFCAFLTWFLLGGINEPTPLAFSFVTTDWTTSERSISMMSAALALGNLVAVVLGGWVADRLGRTAVIRPALLMTISCSMVLQTARTFQEALVARFLLGLVSGSLISVMPSLIAELLPARNRSFYLSVWCCGWPCGAFASVLLGCLSPGLNWRAFYTIMLVPAVIVYVCAKAEMLPESPRYLYLVGRREEGYLALLDMYEKEQLPLPWASETVAVTCAPVDEASSSHRAPLSKAATTPGVLVGMWLGLAMFLISAAAQSMKVWMPILLLRHRALHGAQAHAQLGDPVSASAYGPSAILFFQAAGSPGSAVANLFSAERPPVLLSAPHQSVILVLAQAYAVEILGTIMCAYLSTWVRRRHMVLWSIPTAAVFTLLALGAAESGFLLFCGPLVGIQRTAQACSLNFLYIFALEHFPTCRRAKAVALVSFAAQLGDFIMPTIGGLVVARASAIGAVAFFLSLFSLAWFACLRLPLSTSCKERTLHDVDELRPHKESSGRVRKREFMTYQTM